MFNPREAVKLDSTICHPLIENNVFTEPWIIKMHGYGGYMCSNMWAYMIIHTDQLQSE